MGAIAAAGGAPQANAAASFTVDSTGTATDAKPGDGVCATKTGACTLRAAIHEANGLVGADTIHVPGGVYPISYPATEPNNIRTGDLDISGALTISGAGSGNTIIAGGGRDRVIEVGSASGRVNINDVTVRAGSHQQSGAGVLNARGGTVTIARSHIQNNSASKLGGGVANEQGGTVRLVNGTRLTGNSAGEAGSAVVNLSHGTVEITDGRVSSNASTLGGAAITNTGTSPSEGTITLLSTTVASNVAGGGGSPGGGISNLGDGAVTVDRSTVSGNRSAGSGGGIASRGGGTVDVVDSTIAGNTAVGGSGGGVSNGGEAFLTVASSKLSKNVSSADGGGVESADKGGLLVADSSFSGNSALDGGAIHTSGDQGATVMDSVVSGNRATQSGGGLGSSGTSQGALAIERVTFSRNEADGDGGGLMLDGGPAAVEDSDFRANSGLSGGGLGNHSGGAVSVDASTFEANTAEDQGGGIDNASDGPFTVTRSEVSRNEALGGGGLSSNSDADYTVENTTISGNAALAEGGGVLVLDPVTLASSTVAKNAAPVGAGIQKLGDSRLLLRNTIVGDNLGANCGYEPGTLPIESGGGNLDSEVTCGLIHPTDISGADPLLKPLTNNGGRTRTHALDPKSPAIDEAVSDTCPPSDQRDVARPQNDGCDIGSYEFDGVVPPASCADRGTHLAPAAEDSWIDESDPNKNFGDDATLYVRSGSFTNARALLRFDLPALPAGCEVLGATLRLNGTGGAADRALEAVALASSWTEGDVTWSNQAATTGGAATTASGTGTLQWGVTAHVKDMYAAEGAHGFMIRDAAEGDVAGGQSSFDSRESPSPPQLAITIG